MPPPRRPASISRSPEGCCSTCWRPGIAPGATPPPNRPSRCSRRGGRRWTKPPTADARWIPLLAHVDRRLGRTVGDEVGDEVGQAPRSEGLLRVQQLVERPPRGRGDVLLEQLLRREQ